MTERPLIAPHGGKLIDRQVEPDQAGPLEQASSDLPRVTLSAKQACDLEMIAIGAFSPLTGFVGSADFESICRDVRLRDGTVWPIPITLAVDDAVKAMLKEDQRVALHHPDGTLLAVLGVQEVFRHDKQLEIPSVFGTEDDAHPGVKAVREEGDWLVAGPVEVIRVTPRKEAGEQFPEHRLPPTRTRQTFMDKGWKTVVAFQTRNPIHRAHEYLTKCALEICDGLLIHPLVGATKPGDIPADVRMACYQVLMDKYYLPQRTTLSVMPAAMRYAGPREAILHALVRKNYGCSHFIVGRDHAGVGDYYGTYDAQHIFDDFTADEIGIVPLKFEHASWCRACEGMTSAKTCPHGPDEKIFLSGTKVRELLKQAKRPPMEFSRPEVADLLITWAQSEN